MKHFFYIIRPAICIALAGLACCGRQAAPPLNNAVPQHIVSLSPTVTEILYELGLGDRIIGDTTLCNYPEEAKNKEKVGDFLNVNEEKIISLHPDLLIDTTSKAHEKMWERMKGAGIRVEHFAIDTMDGVYDAYIGIGKIAGVEGKAAELVNNLKQGFSDLKARGARAENKPKVLFVVDYENFVLAGKGTFIDTLLSDIGCVNLITEKGWPGNASFEVLISLKPDIIIVAVNGKDLTEEKIKAIKARWAIATSIPAVAGERVLVVNADTTTRPGPRLLNGWTEEIAKLVHPELFNSP